MSCCLRMAVGLVGFGILAVETDICCSYWSPVSTLVLAESSVAAAAADSQVFVRPVCHISTEKTQGLVTGSGLKLELSHL